jgi:hypothetical protein
MNDIETRVRRALDAHAPVVGVSDLPARTRRRIRLRQGRTAVAMLAAVAVVGFAGLSLASVPLRGTGPAGSVVVPAPSDPNTAPAWDPIEAPAANAWPTTTRSNPDGAYVDRTTGENVSLVIDKTAIEAGTVQNADWSLVALEQNGTGPMWSGAAAGPCAEIFVGGLGENGGGTVCLRLDDTVGTPDLNVAGVVWGQGPITAYVGVTSSRVAAVDVSISSGETRVVRLFDGPAGITARFFAAFVPNGAAGHLVARDASGAVIERIPLCAADLTPAPNETAGCGAGLLSATSPVVSDQP